MKIDRGSELVLLVTYRRMKKQRGGIAAVE